MVFLGLFLIQLTAWPQQKGGARLWECVLGAIDYYQYLKYLEISTVFTVKDFGS